MILNKEEILKKVKNRQQVEQEILESNEFHGNKERQEAKIWTYGKVIHLIKYGEFEMTREELSKQKPGKVHKIDSPDLDMEDSIFNITTLKFLAGEIDLTTGEVDLEKEVSTAAKEFWEAVEEFYLLEDS